MAASISIPRIVHRRLHQRGQFGGQGEAQPVRDGIVPPFSGTPVTVGDLADTAGGAGEDDQPLAHRVEPGGGAQRQPAGAADHLARAFGGHEFHAHRA
ncbi:hypothetical protein [Actinomadura madurae]|uniref:hypothetical protein n=1 Tax=Actinomadura madurae TaxID=1993 RepID=UPI002027223F|nr:hypothetical protein [Actinomadura madurae]MCP9954238.1 hypothetical protein [Actinomadura madurae]MCP9983472.1 hypothetical protein [Actinomadura madurae]MCQ0004964.1 hypothetical protein [Actinomadura madurae]MCQ0019712.1 hypothetical protein [Actinomadura madurae]URM99739.1 hypothetical protein LUW76_38475 [Actinomadura madurae]